jgi:hypothetical protein
LKNVFGAAEFLSDAGDDAGTVVALWGREKRDRLEFG